MLVGSIELLPVPDAVGLLAEYVDAYPGVSLEDWEPYRALYPELFAEAAWRLPCDSYLLRSQGATVLVDTAVGPPGLWGWTAEWEGELPGALTALGVRPDDVDIVFLTHLHVDHVGWNADLEGNPFFPHARYLVHPDALEHARMRPDRPHIRRCIESLLDRFEDVAAGAELAPGTTVFSTPGHYPGHLSIRLRSEGHEAVLLGDVAPHPALLDRNEWVFAFDEDAEQSEATRRTLLTELLDRDVLVVCGHYLGSGIGHVVTRGDRIVWEEA